MKVGSNVSTRGGRWIGKVESITGNVADVRWTVYGIIAKNVSQYHVEELTVL